MTKLFTAATVALVLATSAVSGTASANPTFGFSAGSGVVNPFADKGGN